MSRLLSAHFTLDEAFSSEKAHALGIDNTPPDFMISVLGETATGMERVRAVLEAPIHVDSWYRCLLLNRALKSKDTSQHMRGEAVDFIAPAHGTPFTVCKTIIKFNGYIHFDQLILEHTWVHISFCSNPSAIPRNSVLSLLATGKYATGLTDLAGNPL